MSPRYPVPHPQVATRVVDDEAIVVLADEGQVQVYNAVGTRIWELADGTRSVSDIADQIAAEYQVTRVQAQQDVETFLHRLADANVLVFQERPTCPSPEPI